MDPIDAKMRFIGIGIPFSVALAEWVFMHQFCLTPSLRIINRRNIGCQVDLSRRRRHLKRAGSQEKGGMV